MTGENTPLLHKVTISEPETPPRPGTPTLRPNLIRHMSNSSFKPSSSSSNDDDHHRLVPPPNAKALRPRMKSYWAYYIPAMEWIPHYTATKFWGDFCAGVSLASFQIPLSMSYATSLAHLPAVAGLYALAIPPLVYSIFGSVPQMIVGPEAAISLVVGHALKPYLHPDSDNVIKPIEANGIIAGATGAILLFAGLVRFGFLDSVLSRALLRGFISAVGIVMCIDQSLGLLKLNGLFAELSPNNETTFSKLIFVITHWHQAHKLTAAIGLTSLVVLLILRKLKKQLQGKISWVLFVPEILMVVVVATVLTDVFDWDREGVLVLGKIKPGKLHLKFPLTPSTWTDFKATFSASFILAVLGFFESTIAAKSLGTTFDVAVSTNRELVALGLCNFFGSLFCALPAFGGYGRSKINALSGATTQMSSAVLAIITMLSTAYLMPYFFYLPSCVLSAVITVVGLSLLEEAPGDIAFYWKVGGYQELFTLFLTLSTTIFWSVETGIAVGVGLSVVRVIHHATRPRIQILARKPGTNEFFNADLSLDNEDGTPSELEDIHGCLIVKIPEPLTFANTGDLRTRLGRLELYGSMKVHPSHPRIRGDDMTQFVIFDLNGMTEIDVSAAQILMEIVSRYKDRGLEVYFTRVPNDHKIRQLLEKSGISKLVADDNAVYYNSIEEALRHIDSQA
ncbi:putative sulfate transporter [Yarrowia sp. C11]|nr:putative sulfate transporter [Yarrowia sp. E02]KAG5371865.1 putative sulfate transporter [Yarrowia sp. C11]